MQLEFETKRLCFSSAKKLKGAQPIYTERLYGRRVLPDLTPVDAGCTLASKLCLPKHQGAETGAGKDNAAVTLEKSVPPSKHHLLTAGIFSFFSPFF